MMPLRNILAATDFSAPARHGIERAASLARDQAARLTLLHVVEGGPFADLHAFLGAGASSIESRLMAEVRSRLESLAVQTGDEHGLAVAIELGCGSVATEIAHFAGSIDADLIVLGAWGAGFWQHFVPGTTAARAIRSTLRPLLATKQLPGGPYRQVLVPVDFSPWSIGAVRLARAVAPDAQLLLLHAFSVPFEGLLFIAGVEESKVSEYRVAARSEAHVRLRRLAHEAGLTAENSAGHFTTAAKAGEVVPVILAQEQEIGCDLIVVGKHGRNAAEELLLGSVTSHLVAQSSCDVLVSSRREPD